MTPSFLTMELCSVLRVTNGSQGGAIHMGEFDPHHVRYWSSGPVLLFPSLASWIIHNLWILSTPTSVLTPTSW